VVRERLCEARSPEAALGRMEAVLLEQLTPRAVDPAVAFAVAAFERGAAVADVTARLGLLPRTFVRRSCTHCSASAIARGSARY